MTWVAGVCSSCDFRQPYAVVTAWHKSGTVFDFALCSECLCEWIQDEVIGEVSDNPVVEARWRRL